MFFSSLKTFFTWFWKHKSSMAVYLICLFFVENSIYQWRLKHFLTTHTHLSEKHIHFCLQSKGKRFYRRNTYSLFLLDHIQKKYPVPQDSDYFQIEILWGNTPAPSVLSSSEEELLDKIYTCNILDFLQTQHLLSRYQNTNWTDHWTNLPVIFRLRVQSPPEKKEKHSPFFEIQEIFFDPNAHQFQSIASTPSI